MITDTTAMSGRSTRASERSGRGRGRDRVRFGLDRLLDRLERKASLLAGRRFGLLCHQASVTAEYQLAHLALRNLGFAPTALFGPEHGFYGVEQDMAAAADQKDPWTGVPVLSLYGDSEHSLRPDRDAFADLDLLIVDLQDIGTRYYTFAATAIWAAEVALASGCEVWFLDRPNPLGGERVEGNLPDEGLQSFVGAFSLPVRHGLTLGELARLEARRREWDQDGFMVWETQGWRRRDLWCDLDRSWIAPSPNMPNFDIAMIYPGGCLVEATEISEGRGTTRPFQLIGAPWVEPLELFEALASLELPGVRLVPTYFRPQFQKHAGEVCGGVEILVMDRAAVAPYRLGVELLVALHGLDPSQFAWRHEPYEFVADLPAIDLLTGSDQLRHSLDSGHDLEPWLDSWAVDEEGFRREREAILLYE